jgi:hypothetical protein
MALINPGAGWGAKRWPVERYAEVARGLIDRGCGCWSTPAPAKSRWPSHRQRNRRRGHSAGCSLEQLIALTRRVGSFIAGDTGPLHLACALGRPVVGIYGPTDPSRNGPFGTRFRVLRSPDEPRDHTRYRPEPEAGLLTIQPEDVLRAADELLGRRIHDEPTSPGTATKTGSPAGSASPAASVPVGILRPPRFTCLSCGGSAPLSRPPSPGAWPWFCPASGCAPMPPAT